jgi:hypothetical protein
VWGDAVQGEDVEAKGRLRWCVIGRGGHDDMTEVTWREVEQVSGGERNRRGEGAGGGDMEGKWKTHVGR